MVIIRTIIEKDLFSWSSSVTFWRDRIKERIRTSKKTITPNCGILMFRLMPSDCKTIKAITMELTIRTEMGIVLLVLFSSATFVILKESESKSKTKKRQEENCIVIFGSIFFFYLFIILFFFYFFFIFFFIIYFYFFLLIINIIKNE